MNIENYEEVQDASEEDIVSDFGKHWASMYTGSMYGAGAVVFALMGYVIANQQPSGNRLLVELNPAMLAGILGEEVKDVEKGLDYLCAPDPSSRTGEEEGRRLVKVGKFTYWVVNGRKYRLLVKAERRRHQNRVAQAKFREKHKKGKPLPGETTTTTGDYTEEEQGKLASEHLPEGMSDAP